MYKVECFDNQIPRNIHETAYEYLQTQTWKSNFRDVPSGNINPSNRSFKGDLTPYVAKKTAYYAGLGKDMQTMQIHTPINILFDYINTNLFDNKFEFNGKPLGTKTEGQDVQKEIEDYAIEKEHEGFTSYMIAQPYETVKRTRAPHRDWDDSPLDSDQYYTIVFVANKLWDPVWHAEMFFYDENSEGDPKWDPKFFVNMPGRVIIYDSRLLHSSRSTSILAPELSQRIGFRVKLKEGETYV